MIMPRSIFITGAKSGVGFELVRQFAISENPPEHLFASGRNINRAEELVALAKQHKNIHLVELDVANDQEIADAVKNVSELVGEQGLNLLINNAAILYGNALPHITREEMNDHMNVNATSPFIVIQAFLPLLQKAANLKPSAPMSISKSAVINISSDSASLHIPVEFSASLFGFYGYVAGKGALNIISKNLSFDLKPHGILMAFIDPGFVDTNMTRNWFNSVRQKYGEEAIPDFLQWDKSIKPHESAAEIVSTLTRLTNQHTGGYFKRNGEKMEDFDFESAAAGDK